MARSSFGGTSNDWLVEPHPFGSDTTLVALETGTTTLNFYSAQTGGTHYTDLLDATAAAVTSITVVGHQIPRFQGPDGILAMWTDKGDGSDRELLQAVDLAAIAAAVAAAEDARDDTIAAIANKVTESSVVYSVASGLFGTFVGAGSGATGAADITAINAALAAAESAGGGTVVIPDHAVVVATPTVHTNLITARLGVTLRGGTIKVANSSPAYNAVIGATGDVSGFILDGVTIDQNKDNNPAPTLTAFEYAFAVYLVSGTGMKVQNCTFKNCDGINTVVMNGGSGVDGVINIGNVFITDNIFDNVGTSDNHDHSTIYTNATSAAITGNHFYGRTSVAKSAVCAVEIHGSGHVVTNNHIENYREGVNATGIAYKTDTQVVSDNTILNVMRGIRIYAGINAGTVSPAIRAMVVANNSIVIAPDFWAATHAVETQGVAFVSTQDVAVHGLNIQGNSIIYKGYSGSSTAVHNLLSGGVLYTRTGGATNPDRAIDISGNTIIGALSAGVMMIGCKIQGLTIIGNTALDCGHDTLGTTVSNDYVGGVVLLTGEAVGASIRNNRVYDFRAGGGGRRGVGWFRGGTSAGSTGGSITDNDVKLVTSGHLEVALGATTGAPFVRHRLQGGTTTAPTADSEVGSEWFVVSTGIKLTQQIAPSGASWAGNRDAIPVGRYRVPRGSSSTTRAMTQDTEYCVPIPCAPGQTLDRVALEVTTNIAATSIRVGYRQDAGGVPSAAVTEFGTTMDSTTTGTKELTVSIPVTGSRIWISTVAQGAGGVVVRGIFGQVDNLDQSTNAAATGSFGAFIQSGVSGAFPATAPTSAAGTGTMPAVRAAT